MPKQYVLKLDSPDDVRILSILLQSNITRLNIDPSRNNEVILVAQRVIEACNEVEVISTSTRTKEPTASVPMNLCKEHPTYGARRRPRTDCKTCWEAYERLNGSDAASIARRDYERANGKTQDTSRASSKHATTKTSSNSQNVSQKPPLPKRKGAGTVRNGTASRKR